MNRTVGVFVGIDVCLQFWRKRKRWLSAIILPHWMLLIRRWGD